MRIALLFLLSCLCAVAWTKSGTTYTIQGTNLTDGNMDEIRSAYADASSYDTISIPAGYFTNFGAGGVGLSIAKPNITIRGAGGTNTTFSVAPDASYPFQIVSNGDWCVLRSLALITTNQRTLMEVQNADWWRITDCTLISTNAGTSAYIFYAENAYGLLDTNTFVQKTEQIFMRGKTNAWSLPDDWGSTNAIYFEDNQFWSSTSDYGYTDGNSFARVVYRKNTINSAYKFDQHGLHSSSPRGSRLVECYSNYWAVGGSYATREWRSGTAMDFGNTAVGSPWLIMQEYFVVAGTYTAADYPIDDQIGVGQDPKAAHSSPMYHWGNRRNSGQVWKWEIYSTDMTGVINDDRDVFTETNGTFNGSSGIGIGTKAQMNAITPTLTGVGFFVTDEADWDQTTPGTDGQLYVWSGAAWVLKYTPLTYPHPLRNYTGTPPGKRLHAGRINANRVTRR